MRSPDSQSIPTPTLIFRVEPLPSRDQREPVLRSDQLEALRVLLAAGGKEVAA
jgi:hypothetical protein